MQKPITYIPFVILIVMLCSCSITKDKTYNKNSDQYDNNYNSLVHKPDTKYNLGHGYYRVPTFFKIKVPKHSIRYIALEPKHLIYYKDHQLISIQIDEKNQDTSLDFLTEKPSRDQMENLILENCYSMIPDKYNIKEYKYRKWRRHAIYYKDNATIILYNIKKKNFKSYLEAIKSFEVISK